MANFDQLDTALTAKEFRQRVVAKLDGYTQKQVEEVLNAFNVALTESLSEGRKVQLKGVGQFSVRFRKSREITVPFNGKQRKTADSAVASFKISSTLKNVLAENKDLVKALAKHEEAKAKAKK